MDNATDPVVTTSAGDVRGAWKSGGAVFLGIPYAAAPVGGLRFAAPQSPRPWSGVRDATQPGATPQRRLLGREPSFPEPCVPGDETLNLNVFTPAPGECGTSVMTLLTAPRAQSLFRAAICMSGADRVQSLAPAEQTGRALAASAGVEPTVAGWSALTEDQALDAQDAFRSATPSGPIDPAAFVRHALTAPGDQGMPFGPVIDGDLLPRSVSDALASGLAGDKPLLIGVTAHEFTLWMLHAEQQLR